MERIALEEAQNRLLAHCTVVEKEEVSINHALGKVLGETIEAQENIPPFARSPYDGYALRASDTMEATADCPVVLEVVGEVPAGYIAREQVTGGKAIKISTGAPIPAGADAVVPFEKVKIEDSMLYLYSAAQAGKNIVPMGEDVSKGDCIGRQGSVVTAPVIGLLASLGIAKIQVYRRPKIAVISIGDELIEIDETLAPGKIRNSNSYTLANYCREMGVEPIVIGTARDRVEDVVELLKKGLKEADLVIASGGASVGDYDVTGRAFEALQSEILYRKIEIKPGSPSLAAVKDGKILMGLSGNPAAGVTVFQLAAVPLIKKMAGRKDYLHQKVEVVLKEDFQKKSPVRRFLRGKLDYHSGQLLFEPTGAQGNGVLRSLVSCNVFAEIPSGHGPVLEGERLMAYLIK